MKVLRIFFLSGGLIFGLSAILTAQVNQKNNEPDNSPFKKENELMYKDDESFKEIHFSVPEIISSQKATELKTLLLQKYGILSCDINLEQKTCDLKAKVFINKQDIINLLGQNGIKTSDYKEKVNLMMKVPAIPEEYKKKQESRRAEDNRINSVWPDDFPKFIDTGNPQQDNEDYAKRKNEWIYQNSEKYNELSKCVNSYETDAEKLERDNKEKAINNINHK